MPSLAEAVHLHRAGELGQAAQLYQAILRLNPTHSDALHLLGILLAEQSNPEGLELLQRALGNAPNQPVYWKNYGLALKKAGRIADAIAAFTQALTLAPQDPELHNTMALTFQQAGEPDQAKLHWREAAALDPHHSEALNNLASLLYLEGQTQPAIELYERALEADPQSSGTRSNLARALLEHGNALHQAGGNSAAIRAFRRAVSLQDDFPQAWFNLGVCLMVEKQLEEARACYEKVLALDPDNTGALNNLGHVLQALQQLEAALACYRRAIAADPLSIDARYNLGVTLQSLERYPEAITTYNGLLALNPAHSDSWNNLGGIHLSLNQTDPARQYYRQALHYQPNHADAAWNLALIQLQAGDFENGWRGYELRRQQKTFPSRPFPAPFWEGQELNGKHILVWAEQGLGDTIQFARFLPLLVNSGVRVTLECQSRLAPLLQSLDGVQVVCRGDSLPAADYQVPLLSLPYYLGTRLDAIPPPARLTLDASNRGRQGAIRIGLSWAGNPSSKTGRLRSIPPDLLAPLAEIRGIELFNLQLEETPPFLAPGPDTIPATAALIGELDLVITVDTMIAHLAATLGRPTWALLPFAADWRWMLDRRDSPWYPAMRLFRQPRLNDWPSVIRQVIEEIECLKTS